MDFNNSKREVGELKGSLYARVLRIKKDWKSLIFLLILPFSLTILATKVIDFWGEESKIPIGLVVEDKSQLSSQLIKKLQDVPYLNVMLLDYLEAINELEKHKLDSVFVIDDHYEEMMMDGKRNQLVDAYSSNRSYAYFAVKELITSFVQEDVSRSKAAYEVRDLFKEYGMDEQWNWEEIVQASIEKQESQQLLQTNFTYQNQGLEIKEDPVLPIISTWGLWAIFSMFSTFFLFDWVVKEKRPELQIRWLFTTNHFKKFASFSFIFFTVIMIIMDGLSLMILSELLQQPIPSALWISLLFYKVVVSLLAFLWAILFKKPLLYYVSSIGFTLILTLLGGVIIPIEGLTKQWSWVENLSPMTGLLREEIPYGWLLILLGLFTIWYLKGDKSHA